MIFHENRLLTDDSHEIIYPKSFFKLGKIAQNLLSAAVVIGALRVKIVPFITHSFITWSIPIDPKYSIIKGLHCILKQIKQYLTGVEEGNESFY